MQHKAAPQHAAMAQHQREQPDDPLDARLVREHRSEMREIHLRLAPGRGLEADLERRHLVGPDLAQQVGKDGITAAVAELTQFAVQPAAGQLRKRRQALAQIGLEGLQLRYPRLAWTVRWRLQPLCDVSTHCLAVELHPAGDGRNADTLAMQFKDHDDLPKSDQRRIPQSERDIIAHQRHLLARILRLRPSAHLGNFQPAQVGIIRPALTNLPRADLRTVSEVRRPCAAMDAASSSMPSVAPVLRTLALAGMSLLSAIVVIKISSMKCARPQPRRLACPRPGRSAPRTQAASTGPGWRRLYRRRRWGKALALPKRRDLVAGHMKR